MPVTVSHSDVFKCQKHNDEYKEIKRRKLEKLEPASVSHVCLKMTKCSVERLIVADRHTVQNSYRYQK